jgi:hypothetical protein
MSSLMDCIQNANMIKEPKFRNVDFAEGVWIKVIADSDGYFWVKNNQGALLTIAPATAEKGWSLFLEKRKEKWCAWYFREPNIQRLNGMSYKPSDWAPVTDLGKYYRVEQLDFEIEITD